VKIIDDSFVKKMMKLKHRKELIIWGFVGRVEFEGMAVRVEVDDLKRVASPIPHILLCMAVKDLQKKNAEMEVLSLDYLNLGVVLEAFEENLLVELSLVIVFLQLQVEALAIVFCNLDPKNYPSLMDMEEEALQQNALNALNYVEVLRHLMVHHWEFQDNL
jgi:hypothetical protein